MKRYKYNKTHMFAHFFACKILLIIFKVFLYIRKLYKKNSHSFRNYNFCFNSATSKISLKRLLLNIKLCDKFVGEKSKERTDRVLNNRSNRILALVPGCLQQINH